MLAALFALLPLAYARSEYLNSSREYGDGALGMSPFHTFQSSPSKPVIFNFNQFPTAPPAPGHLFIAPRGTDVTSRGGHIFEWDGELVWDGTEYGEAMSFTPFDYKNGSAIAVWQGAFNMAGYGRGFGLILDQTYSVIGNISTTVPDALMDFHEFQLTDNGTALITVYATTQADLTPFGSNLTNGYLMSGHAQEIDIATGKALWTWNSLEHVDPSKCYATPGATGSSAADPWDYFHINSIAKDRAGNYMISSRHCNAVYYVNGTDGQTIWQMGGNNSTLTMGNNTAFSYQHDARFRGNNTISLFDNAGTDWVKDRNASRGMVLTVDADAKTVELQHEMAPFNQSISESQGSFDLQPAGTYLAGWGQMPFVSEYDANGTLLWSAQFGVGDVQSYRAHRYEWKGYPKTNPNLTVSTNTSTGNYDMFVSWNGATEVVTWELLGGNSTGSSGASLFNVSRTGFETQMSLGTGNASYTAFQACARDRDGKVLGYSSFVGTNGSTLGAPGASQTSEVTPPTSSANGTKPTGAANVNSGARSVGAPIAITAVAALLACAF